MRVDVIIRDVRKTLEAVLQALDQNLTASENLRGEGKAGQVLVSQGPDKPPVWMDLNDVPPTGS